MIVVSASCSSHHAAERPRAPSTVAATPTQRATTLGGPIDPYHYCLTQGRTDCGPDPSQTTTTTPAPPARPCLARQLAITFEGSPGLTGGTLAGSFWVRDTSSAACSVRGYVTAYLLDGRTNVVAVVTKPA